MDTRLQIVERLYAEGEDNHVPHPSRSEEGEDLARDFQAMSQAKFWMDHRRPQRPDGAVVDRVVAAAAAASRGEIPGVVRPDRSPLRLLSSPRVRLAVAATLVIGIVGLGVWRVALEPPFEADAISETARESAEDATVLDALRAGAENEVREEFRSRGKAEAPRPSLAFADDDAEGEPSRRDLALDSSMRAGRMAVPATVTAVAAIEWDDTDELVRLHQRIDRLRQRQVDEGWDKPVVPLEMMPTDGRASGILPAGSSGN